MLKPFLAIFKKFKYLTTATLTPKRNTVYRPERLDSKPSFVLDTFMVDTVINIEEKAS